MEVKVKLQNKNRAETRFMTKFFNPKISFLTHTPPFLLRTDFEEHRSLKLSVNVLSMRSIISN